MIKRSHKLLSVLMVAALSLPLTPVAFAFAEDEPLESGNQPTSMITDEEISEVLGHLPPSEALSSESMLRGFSGSAAFGSGAVTEFSGATRYDVAAQEALYAYNSSEWVILAGGEGWADALSATSLAGALNCPILLTDQQVLPECTIDAMSKLGVRKVIVVGGPNTVSDQVVSSIEDRGFAFEKRLEGADRYEVQLNIYRYGIEKGCWSSDRVIVASGERFSDALSVSPVAYRDHVPIFLVGSAGRLNADQMTILLQDAKSRGMFKETIVVGGPASVSEGTAEFMSTVSEVSSGADNNVIRLGGADRYEASASIARWASTQGFSWNGVSFSSGEKPYDALAGSAVQGSEGSILLLVDSNKQNPAVLEAVAHKGSIKEVKFFGGTDSVSQSTRQNILASLGLEATAPDVTYRNYPISLSQMADLEVKASVGYQGYTKDQILEFLDPDNFSFGQWDFYQFAVLSNGYSGTITASQLNSYISSVPKGASGNLAGLGQLFIDAAKATGVNEVYLLSHAILESGWGTSELASGYEYEGGYIDGTYYPAGTYYNFYGIGAYDSSPLSGGRKLAIINGWNSPELAITGAAKWIGKWYVNESSNPQNTLYKMKWDIQNAINSSNPWHQYATAHDWAVGIAWVMHGCYSYNGIDMKHSGLVFEVPLYQ